MSFVTLCTYSVQHHVQFPPNLPGHFADSMVSVSLFCHLRYDTQHNFLYQYTPRYLDRRDTWPETYQAVYSVRVSHGLLGRVSRSLSLSIFLLDRVLVLSSYSVKLLQCIMSFFRVECPSTKQSVEPTTKQSVTPTIRRAKNLLVSRECHRNTKQSVILLQCRISLYTM